MENIVAWDCYIDCFVGELSEYLLLFLGFYLIGLCIENNIWLLSVQEFIGINFLVVEPGRADVKE